mmetsp:Transcript_34761/g.74132  ORF Transcript_34761/g.74132 Transcript_34761/m.74132 type:complete len:278 (-) Transcript_34761:82-915(-)
MAMSVKMIAETPMAEVGPSADKLLVRQSGKIGKALNMTQQRVRDMSTPTTEKASIKMSLKKLAKATLSPKQAIPVAKIGTHFVPFPITISHWRSSCGDPVISQLRAVIHIVYTHRHSIINKQMREGTNPICAIPLATGRIPAGATSAIMFKMNVIALRSKKLFADDRGSLSVVSTEVTESELDCTVANCSAGGAICCERSPSDMQQKRTTTAVTRKPQKTTTDRCEGPMLDTSVLLALSWANSIAELALLTRCLVGPCTPPTTTVPHAKRTRIALAF